MAHLGVVSHYSKGQGNSDGCQKGPSPRVMWSSVVKRSNKRPSEPDLAPTPRDRERVDGIINRISEETLLVFDLLKDGMVKEASFKTVEESITRHCILSTFEQVRVDAFRDAAGLARQQARKFAEAALEMPEPQQRQFVLSVSQAFERFAKQLQTVEQRAIAEKQRRDKQD
ncbi:hypothetical protein FNB15_16390 [Ferrovibrio terrae]|jgi:hypothetical protein|uniref:Uncharacterized protein n=1 Tax=Ferrovibrio terrae TaxID=2594003 RepID=A0A516H4S2_9PROT|nr:hypothetical protein [Ferrovibrio terrae]QDO98755.1 hypothetical protein FNB15_16390 [Ferrovibrio terrae]